MKKFFTIAIAAIAFNANAQTWVEQNSNFPNNSMYPLNMSLKGDNVVWAYGGDGSSADGDQADEYSRIFTKTSNGGTTWVSGQMTGVPTTVNVSDIAAGDANTAWILAYPTSGTGGVWKTKNGGANWTKQATASFISGDSFPNVIYFWDMNTGVALGDPIGGKLETYVTANGGDNWQAVSGPTTISGEYGYVHNKSVAGNTIWCGSNKGRIFRSNDKGVTWLSTVSTPLSDFGSNAEFGYIALKDANNAWVVSSLGLVYKTTDGGANFSIVEQQSGTLYPTSFVYVPGTNQTLICGGGSSTYGRGSAISYDGGINWIEITNNNADSGITSLATTSTTSIYGGSFHSTTAGGGMNKLTGVLATSESAAMKGISVSPNPTYGDLNISTVLSVKSIEILDMNGRIVKTFGADSKKLNLSSLQVGVYAVKVNTADGKSQITKFIKK